MGQRVETPSERYLRVRDSLEAAVAVAQQEAAPDIRLYVQPNYHQISSYVNVDFRTDDDGYALVLALDYDNRVRVLYPESPSGAGLVSQRDGARLRPVFAGFGSTGDARYQYLRGGVVVALASARPFQLERITSPDGQWDERAIARLLDRTTVAQGTEELGRALTMVGQDFSYDYTTFNTPAARTLALASRGSMFADCSGVSSLYYASLPDPNSASALNLPAVRYLQIGGQLYAQYLMDTNGCGRYSSPVPIARPIVPQAPRDTTKKSDSAKVAPSTFRLRQGPHVTAQWTRDDTAVRGSALEVGAGPTTGMRRALEGVHDRGWSAHERPLREGGPTGAAPSRPQARPTAPADGAPAASHLAAPSRSEPARSERARSEPARAEPSRPAPSRPAH